MTARAVALSYERWDAEGEVIGVGTTIFGVASVEEAEFIESAWAEATFDIKAKLEERRAQSSSTEAARDERSHTPS